MNPPLRLHCSYHKCLTVYFHRVMNHTFNKTLTDSRGYRHFNSRVEEFYAEGNNYDTVSLNNCFVDLERLGDCRVTRFVRDPRDLVVSGYFYHKRGAERWCLKTDVNNETWEGVNGTVPPDMKPEHSYASFLQSIDEESGLLAELQFRTRHFESMGQWNAKDQRIRLYRYEDIIGRERDVFAEIMDFYEFDEREKEIGMGFVDKFSLKNQDGKIEHIRNPSPGQWRSYFTPKLTSAFNEKFGNLLAQYGYEN